MLLVVLCRVGCQAQTSNSVVSINFKAGDAVMYQSYKSNISAIAKMQQEVARFEDVILTGNGHIRLIASVPKVDRNNPQALNLAASRAATVRTYIRQRFRMLTKWNFTFYIDARGESSNTVKVEYVASPVADNAPIDIYYTLSVNNPKIVAYALKKYAAIPYLETATVKQDTPLMTSHLDSIATNPIRIKPNGTVMNSAEALVAIYFRWDKYKLDSLYLSNPQQLATLDSILTRSQMQQMDTLTIVAFASPEGHPDYNKRLSERRGNTLRNYILSRYSAIDPDRVVTIARGENWEGLSKFVWNDPYLPSREEVLEILTSGMDDLQKQRALTKLDGGKTYYRYILPNYYRFLRNGASVFISYRPGLPELPLPKSPDLISPTGLPDSLYSFPVQCPVAVINYPIAFRTNLLYDAVGAANLGVELPWGKKKNWSALASMGYAYWRSPRNLYALQTLEYGVEMRYWFPVSKERKEKNVLWTQPLKGFYVGAYGHYWHRFDAQFIDGYQGDTSWSAGLTAGYSIPLNRCLALDLGIGAGYVDVSEYRHYHQPEYDEANKYHLMWQETGTWGGFSLTKFRIALVWLIHTQTLKKGGKW